MRITALYVAVVLMLAGVLMKHWGTAGFSASERIEVGTRGFTEYSSYDSTSDDLHELNGMGMPLEGKGTFALIAGVAAAISCAVASQLIRRERSLAVRAGLCVPLAISLVATAVFASALPKYLDIGWSVYACVAAALLGIVAILPRRVAV